MVKVHAAKRLLTADADEALARKYIKSVAGIDVGKMEHTSPDTIRFTVQSKDDFLKARQELIKHFGKPDTKMNVGWSQAGKWMIDPEKVIMLDDTRYGGGQQQFPYSISLVDRAHRESLHRMIERVVGPPKPIPKR